MKPNKLVPCGPTSPASQYGADMLYDLPTQMLPSTRENIVVRRITVLEPAPDYLRVRRDGLWRSPPRDYREALVGSEGRLPERGRLTIDPSGITVVPMNHSPGTIMMAREVFRRQSESLS